MDNQFAQERQRRDDVLYNFECPSQTFPLKTKYKLLTQKYMHDDARIRQGMINGIGPMG